MMGATSDIEWTNATWTPIRARNLKTGKVGWHCEHASDGCKFCYAEAMNKRLGTGLPFKPGHRKDIEIFLDTEMLTAPLRWKKPRMVFCCSMTDLFADFVKDEWINNILAVMALCPQHTFQVLTKRPERMKEYFSVASSNVWLGTSVERQQEADERIPLLMQTPAAVRFISAEPLLGPIDLGHHLGSTANHEDLRGLLNWLIVGGESGPHARPMHPQWARDLRDQCAATGVPFFFKQWGGFRECERRGEYYAIAINRHPMVVRPDGQSFPYASNWDGNDRDGTAAMERISKHAAGRLLDGVEHNGMPKVASAKQ